MRWLADLPTTSLRIVVTLLLVAGTAVMYWTTGRSLDGEWLAFLAVMSGLDSATFVGKRATTKAELMPATGGEPQPAGGRTGDADPALLSPKPMPRGESQ